MAIKCIKTNYSFTYSSEGMFIIDNNTLKKTKLFYSKDINKKTLIEGKILGKSFTIKSYPDREHIMYNGHIGMINYTAFIYIDNEKIGFFEKDQAVILNPNDVDQIPITLWMDDLLDYYRATYLSPCVREIKVFHKNKLMGYTKKNKDKYDLYIKSEENFPLFLTLFLAAFNSSIS